VKQGFKLIHFFACFFKALLCLSFWLRFRLKLKLWHRFQSRIWLRFRLGPFLMSVLRSSYRLWTPKLRLDLKKGQLKSSIKRVRFFPNGDFSVCELSRRTDVFATAAITNWGLRFFWKLINLISRSSIFQSAQLELDLRLWSCSAYPVDIYAFASSRH
jgi:hypothetical protein